MSPTDLIKVGKFEELKSSIINNDFDKVKKFFSTIDTMNKHTIINKNSNELLLCVFMAFNLENIEMTHFILNQLDDIDVEIDENILHCMLHLACLKGGFFFNYFKQMVKFITVTDDFFEICVIIACEYNDVDLLEWLITNAKIKNRIDGVEIAYNKFRNFALSLNFLCKIDDIEPEYFETDQNNLIESNCWIIGRKLALEYESNDIIKYLNDNKL